MKNIFLILLLIIMPNSETQNSVPSNENYLSLISSYTFDFPMFNISMELPKNTGFKVPFWKTNNAFLEIENKNVTYFYDATNKNASKATFSYSLSKEECDDFIISFYQYPSEEIEKTKTSIDINANLPDLKSKLGTFKGLKGENEGVREYYLIKNSLLILCATSSTSSKKIRKFEKIITSFNFVDLTEKQNKYLDLVSSGYFEEKENTETEDFDDKIDITSSETTFSFPAFGLKMTYPENWETTIRSTQSAIKKDKNTTEVKWTVNDLSRQGFLMFDSRSKNMLVMTRILKNPENDEGDLPDFSQGTKLIKKFPIVVDGIQTEAKLTGLQQKANLFFNLRLKSYVVCFSVYDILLDEIPVLESLISTIHFSEKEKSGLQKAPPDIKPLDKQLNLKSYVAEVLPVYKLDKPTITNSLHKIQASFNNPGISFLFSVGKDIHYPEDSEIKNHKIIMKGKAEREYKIISAELPNDQTLTANICYFNNYESFENQFENSFRDMKQSTKIRKAGFVIVNDKKWGVLEYTQSGKRRYEFSTAHNDAEFTICLSSQTDFFDSKNKAELENMLFSVRFD